MRSRGGPGWCRGRSDIDLEMVLRTCDRRHRSVHAGAGAAWDEHRAALLVRRDLAAALEPLAAEPSVVHIRHDRRGRAPALQRFYADQFLPHVPGDLALSTISRTADLWRLVEETTVSFTHDRVLPRLLPIKPTYRPAEGAGHRRRRIRPGKDPIPADPLDHAPSSPQLGIALGTATGRAASGLARRACGPLSVPGAWCDGRDRRAAAAGRRPSTPRPARPAIQRAVADQHIVRSANVRRQRVRAGQAGQRDRGAGVVQVKLGLALRHQRQVDLAVPAR